MFNDNILETFYRIFDHVDYGISNCSDFYYVGIALVFHLAVFRVALVFKSRFIEVNLGRHDDRLDGYKQLIEV